MSGWHQTGQLQRRTLQQGRSLCGQQLWRDGSVHVWGALWMLLCLARICKNLNKEDMLCVLPQVVEGKLSAGELSSFVIYALYVGSNVGSLASVISNLIQVSMSTCSRELSNFAGDPSCALSHGQTLRHCRACSKTTWGPAGGDDTCLGTVYVLTLQHWRVAWLVAVCLKSLPGEKYTRQLTPSLPVQAVGASRRVFELLDREPKQPPAGEATPKGSQGGGEVIFENVWCACHTLHMSSRSRHDAGAAMRQLAGTPCDYSIYCPGEIGTSGPGPGTNVADDNMRPV